LYRSISIVLSSISIVLLVLSYSKWLFFFDSFLVPYGKVICCA